MNVRSAIAVAILVGSLGVQASAAERPATNAAYLQMVFTQTADECKATQIAWAHAHSPGARQGNEREPTLSASPCIRRPSE